MCYMVQGGTCCLTSLPIDSDLQFRSAISRNQYIILCTLITQRTTESGCMHAPHIDCFNHRVVTMVADNLKRQWLCIVYFANCTRQPRGSLPDHHWSCIFERGHTCTWCIKEYAIIIIFYSNHWTSARITTKASWNAVVVSRSQMFCMSAARHDLGCSACQRQGMIWAVLHVSGKVWFGLAQVAYAIPK